AGAPGLRRRRVRGVARRRAGPRVSPELDRLRDRDRHDAVLVGERRVVDGVVLDVELLHTENAREAIGPDERREARPEADLRLAVDRQQLAIPPEVPWPRLDQLAR